MKMQTIFSIASIITIFALLPAVIILQIRVLDIMPDIKYIFIIMDFLIVGFIALEIYQLVKKLKKDKISQKIEDFPVKEEKIEKEWNKDNQKKDKTNDEK